MAEALHQRLWHPFAHVRKLPRKCGHRVDVNTRERFAHSRWCSNSRTASNHARSRIRQTLTPVKSACLQASALLDRES